LITLAEDREYFIVVKKKNLGKKDVLMMRINKIYVLVIVASFLSLRTVAVDIGSDTAVNRFSTQQVLSDGDRIAGFAALEAGFKLSDSVTTATFDSFFPVSGEVNLADGTLVLKRDLIFSDASGFKQLGDVVGAEHSMEFSASMTCIPFVAGASSYLFSDLKVFLHSDLILKDCSIKFSGQSLINGRGNCLTLDPSCTIVVDSNSDLLIEDITIVDVDGTNIQCTDASSMITLKNTEWILDGDYTFATGKFNVLKDFAVVGDGYTFAYETDQVSTVSTNGRFILDNGVTFSYDPPIASRELLVLHESTSELILNGATLHATTTGMRLTTGRLIIDRASVLSSEGSVDAEGISFANDLSVQWFPAANLDFLQGVVVVE